MRLLITGANGLLGQKLVNLLHQRGIAFLATSHGSCRIQLPDVNYRSLDVTDRNSVIETVGEYAPTVIVNAAAMTQVDQCETDRENCWQLNVMAVAYLIEAASRTNARLIHLSTDFIFDGTSGPYREQDLPNPIN
jgi:dTDP-4-dehydrorhamnose reductase